MLLEFVGNISFNLHVYLILGAVHMRWAGPARWAGSPWWDDFYPAFIRNLPSHFNQKVCYVAGKIFDHVVFKGATKSYFTHYSSVVIVLIRLYVGLQFLQFLLENQFFIFQWFLCFLFWIKTLKHVLSCYVIFLRNFGLTLYKNSLFIVNYL